jgi:hypothetical protein
VQSVERQPTFRRRISPPRRQQADTKILRIYLSMTHYIASNDLDEGDNDNDFESMWKEAVIT